MPAFRDLTGLRFGRLIAKSRTVPRSSPIYWFCVCDCGNTRNIMAANLTRGLIRSCGCLRRDFGKTQLCKFGAESKVTHGLARQGHLHPLYWRWSGMWARCSNPAHISYRSYGGRGIKVCERWRDFSAFLADVGMPPTPKCTLERIDNDGDYKPKNVRWATYKEQSQNTSRNHLLTFRGETHNITDWALAVGVPRATLDARLQRGWTTERALNIQP